MSNKDLIGKKIYKVSRYGIDSILGTVERVTPTTAIVGWEKFRLPLGGNMTPIGEGSFSFHSYAVETPELNEKFEKKNLIAEIKGILSQYNSEDKLTLEEVNIIKDIVTGNHIK